MNVYVRELSRELGRRGYLVDIFTHGPGGRAGPAPGPGHVNSLATVHDDFHRSSTSQRRGPEIVSPFENVRVIHLSVGPEGSEGKRHLSRHLREFYRELLAFQEAEGVDYDLIHAHYWLSGWLGLALRDRWQAPLVVMFHTLGELKRGLPVAEKEPPCRVAIEQRVAQEADRIICASLPEKRALTEVYGATAERIDVVPCGVDLARFRPLDKSLARRELGLNGEKTVLFVGRMEPLKGLDVLLSAAARVDEPRLKVLVVGGDGEATEELRRLRALSDDLGIGEQVCFVGPVGHDKLPLFYNAADLCVVPSYYESFCLVALEAMACGTPVVGSRVDGLTVTIRDGETGYLVAGRGPQPFAERMSLLLGDEELRESIGRSASESAADFSWSNVADAVERIYGEMLAASVGSARLP